MRSERQQNNQRAQGEGSECRFVKPRTPSVLSEVHYMWANMLPYRIRIQGALLGGSHVNPAAGETDKGVGQAMTPALVAVARHEADPLDKLSTNGFTYLRTRNTLPLNRRTQSLRVFLPITSDAHSGLTCF